MGSPLGESRSWTALTAIFCLSVVVPLQEALIAHPTFFAVRHYSLPDLLILFGVVIAAIVCVPYLFVRFLACLPRLVAASIYDTILCGGFGLLLAPAIASWNLHLGLHIVLVALASLLLYGVYRKVQAVRRFVALLAWSPLFAALWLFVATPLEWSGGTAYAEAASESHAVQTPVVVILFDELPLASLLTDNLEIDADRFPNFYRLSQASTWYRDAVAAADYTMSAVPPIVTGRYVSNVQAESLHSTEQGSLFTNPALSHYDMRAFERMTKLCPAQRCASAPTKRDDVWYRTLRNDLRDLGNVFAHQIFPSSSYVDLQLRQFQFVWLDNVHQLESEECIDVALTWLEEVKRQQLTYLHMPVPHHPFSYLPQGMQYPDMDRVPLVSQYRRMDGILSLQAQEWHESWSQFLWASEWSALQGLQRHQLAAQYVDYQLGRFLDVLESHPLYDEMLIVLLSDHGMVFENGVDARALQSPWRDVYAQLAHIPLMIKYPDQREARRDDRPVSVIDVAPTIVETLLQRPAPEMDGMSLYGDIPKTRERFIVPAHYAHETPLISIQSSMYDLAPVIRDRDQWLSPVNEKADKWFGLDARPGIRGRSVESFSVQDGSAFFQADVFVPDIAHGEQRLLPSRVKGRLIPQGALSAAVPIALVQDGEVVAVTETVQEPHDDYVWFSAMLTPDQARRGPDRIEVYLIVDQALVRVKQTYHHVPTSTAL